MGSEVLAAIIDYFAQNKYAFVKGVIAEILDAVPELSDPSFHEIVAVNATESLDLFLDVLANGLDPQSISPSSLAIANVERAVTDGVPLTAILRAYRVGHGRMLSTCLAEMPADAPGAAEAMIEVVNLSGSHNGRVTEQITALYEDRLTQRVRTDEAIRRQWITRLLNDSEPDVAQAESALGYRLSGSHLAVEAWADDTADADALPKVVTVLRQVLPGVDDVLVLGGESQQRIWLRLPAAVRVDHDELARRLCINGLRVAVGRRGEGLDGFRSAARTAARVKELARSAPHEPQVVLFDDVASVALLADEPADLAAFVAAVLGSLADDDARCEQLRETIRAFLAANCSYTETAKRTMFHRNTVYLRVQQSVDQYGLRLDADTLTVALALEICRWYGGRVLAPVS
ncbi:PucR family transcriptional regulator [Mycobacterium sp. SMC-21]|uniref:PucR family transcriptional regulator n=1 Tax=unclassified Mycobacterium TaxID=2642494 RepID=UPI003204780B